MRLYCLCTSYNPLTLYLYRSGFARFTHERYTNDDIQSTRRCNFTAINSQDLHLTNVAIQKHSNYYNKDKGGGKWDVRHLKLFLISKFGEKAVNKSFSEIQRMMVHLFKSV